LINVKSLYIEFIVFIIATYLLITIDKKIFLKIDGLARQPTSPPLDRAGCEFEPTPSNWPAPPHPVFGGLIAGWA